MSTFVLIAVLFSYEGTTTCPLQNYRNPEIEPDWECEAPMEGAIVPKIATRPSAAIDVNTPAPFTGILLDPQKIIALGLRIKALRRLLWLEMRDRQKIISIEREAAEDIGRAELELALTQRDACQDKAERLQAEIEGQSKWYKSWSFGYTVGTAVSLVSIGLYALVLH